MDHSLLISEIALLDIPKRKFNKDSLTSGDKFMKFAIDIFSKTLINLLISKYLKIVNKEIYPVKFFTITIYKKEKYTVQLIQNPSHTTIMGYLEETTFEQFKSTNVLYLDNLVGSVLQQILNEQKAKKTFINPGKAFLLRLIENQKLDLFSIGTYFKWLSQIVYLKITKTEEEILNLKKEQIGNPTLTNQELAFLEKTIKSELRKFNDES